jgi:propanol-preferring alcohol dehydrogenase
MVGVGGLGHMAIQLLRVLAHEVVNNRDAATAADRIRHIAGSRGAGMVLDCTGVQPTVDLGSS